MSIGKLGFIGEKLDLEIAQGKTFGPFLLKTLNPDGSPVDLTGYRFDSVIRKTPKSPVVAVINCTITDPLAGEMTFGLDADATALIKAGSDMGQDESKYVWELEMTDPSGRVTPRYFGNVAVFRQLTY